MTCTIKERPVSKRPEPPIGQNSAGVGTRSPVWREVKMLKPFCPECGCLMVHSTFANWAEWDFGCGKCSYKCKN